MATGIQAPLASNSGARTETAELAREFIGSDYLREAMGRAGISDKPDIQVVEVLKEGSA